MRGRDADGRLRELAAARRAARPLLGALALALTEGRVHERLGYRCLGDYGREHLGVGGRTLREWARVWRALQELPLLREAVLSGELSWAVARCVVGLVAPHTEAACLETVRGRTLRAVEAIVRTVKEAETHTGEVGFGAAADDEEERVRVRLPCTRREAGLWQAAIELARRVAGESLPVWRCAELVAAEAASAIGRCRAAAPPGVAAPHRAARCEEPAPGECGLREQAFPGLSWRPLAARLPPALAALVKDLDACTPRQLDRRLCAAIAFLQEADFETGRILRQMVDRRLFGEIGFAGLAEYARERLDASPRTARRLVALARAEHRAPAVASAFRRGEVHAFQAHALARVADRESAAAWVQRARQVSFRRLEDEAEAVPAVAVAFHAPPEVAAFFLEMLGRAGSLERLLAHAIATWVEQGQRFHDYADFARDGYRCVVPGCTARRNLQSHHIWMRSHQGPDLPWNRVTLCTAHHLHGVHGGGALRILGHAPDQLVFALGREEPERFAAGDVRLGNGRQPTELEGLFVA